MRVHRALGAILLLSGAFSLTASNGKGGRDAASNPFSNGGDTRNMIVVMSDIHLGADLRYAECNANLARLEATIRQIGASRNVKELVIAGDLIDEWFIPATVDTYGGKDQADFVTRVAKANKGVIDALNMVIKDGKVTVIYIPGNHDLTISEANIARILPGIKQARDEGKLGLGTYSPADLPQLAIEHSHRYNFFCAPDPISNQDVAPGTILPPGYFFTRLAALHVVEGKPRPGDAIPVVTKNSSGSASPSQDLLYAYWGDWAWSLKLFTISEKYSDKIFTTNIDGFKRTYAVNDFLPYQKAADGTIAVGLFNGIQDNWAQRQAANNVAVSIPAARAIALAASAEESDNQAINQYFMNPNSDKRIVVFGHTHVPKIIASSNTDGQGTIYANSGTWIDHNNNLPTMDFVIVTPQSEEPSSKTTVSLYTYQSKVATKLDEASIRL